MNGTLASLLFLGVCVVLAALLLAGAITPFASGGAFTVALVLLGGLSGGFRRKKS